jgi:hypothetical protein
METSELLKKVRKIEIKTRGLSRNIFAGEYHSAFKGGEWPFQKCANTSLATISGILTGMLPHGTITLCKNFRRRKGTDVMLLIDVRFREFGTFEKLKKNIITEISAILSFSAIQNNDKIGVIFFSIKLKSLSAQKRKNHTLRIIRELIDFQPEERGTDIAGAIRYLTNVIKKRCTAFIISDFMDDNTDWEMALSIANNKHDVVALKIYDEREIELPPIVC